MTQSNSSSGSTPRPPDPASILDLDEARETQALYECLILCNDLMPFHGRSHPIVRSLVLRLSFCLRHRRLDQAQRANLDQLIRVLRLDLAHSRAQASDLLL